MSHILDVYLQKDTLVGTLEQIENGALIFTYDANYLNTALYGISISLPLQEEPYTGSVVKAYFSGLLPDDNIRKRLAQNLGISDTNTFALLEAVGGDCAGALALYPHGDKPSEVSQDVELLDDKRLLEVLDLIKRRPMMAGDNGYRLSLAGAQNKLAVGFRNGHVELIKGGAPTTHILKPIIEHSAIKDSAHNELFCMRLAKKIAIDVPNTELHFVGDIPYYLIERYDRHIDKNGMVTRIHQEDFCQAMGFMPEMKYENEGGPNIDQCQQLINQYTIHPARAQLKFLDMIIFNYLIGNNDAHGKNFSLLYKSNKPELAPAYDLLSTAVYPSLSSKMAMKIGGKYKPSEVCLRYFYKLTKDTQTAKSAMDKQIKAMGDKIVDKAITLRTTLKSDGIQSEIFADIINLIEDRLRFLKG
ncbi:MAG: type II toxin-antitoxin system HipA family toxin [Alphaproteobacteria bacterium]